LTTERSTFANKILELALNRTSKSVDPKAAAAKNQLEIPKSTTSSPVVMVQKISQMQDNINMMNGIIMENQEDNTFKKLNPEEIERTKQMLQKDISTYNNDLRLLSLLLGRPINPEDIPKLTAKVPKNLGIASVRGTPAIVKSTATSTTTTTTTQRPTTKSSIPTFRPLAATPAFKPLSNREEELLIALQNIQTTKVFPTTTTTTVRSTSLGKSQEAVLAALLKQQGFGPNNQVPIDVSFLNNYCFNL
jgi:TolA-binding protein